MSNPFQTSGASAEKQSKYAPLLIDRFFTGQYSNSSPLRDAAVPLLYSRFYSGNRYDTIRNGLNVEISPRLTMIRRPGTSLYNSQTFATIKRFYDFRVFNSLTLATQIFVIADTATAVYDATGPNTKTLLFTKSAGAGQTSFQSVGNNLYMANGVDNKVYRWFPLWQANTLFQPGTVVTDSNGNLQRMLGGSVQVLQSPAPSFNSAVTITAGVLTLKTTSAVDYTTFPGQSITFTGFAGAAFLNGTSLVCTSASLHIPPHGSSDLYVQVKFNIVHADYGPSNDSGSLVAAGTSGTSGGSAPSWSTTFGGSTTDNNITWIEQGPIVQDWGIIPPVTAPSVSNAIGSTYPAWAASTFYWSSLIIKDPNNNIQLLTTAGTTAGAPPVFAGAGTTADGTAVWTFQGQAAWQANHAYTAGQYLALAFTKTFTTTLTDPVTRRTETETITVNYSDMFQAQNSGTSGGTQPAWNPGIGSAISDNGVTWINVGPIVSRVNAVSSANNIGNTTAVTLNTFIADANGKKETPRVAGLSGGVAPTWSSALGSSTTDNQIVWTNGGPLAGANTAAWIYAYAFKNSVSGQISSASPPSSPIILAAGNYISLTGQSDPNALTDGADTLVIYRSVQGFSSLFELAEIPMPLIGIWQYQDTSPDPPDPNSTLNEFILADTTGNNAPPPAGLTNLTYYLNRIFGSSGTFQYYSGVAAQPVGVGAESWPGLNFAQMPELIIRSWPAATGLLIFTTHGVFFSQGIDGNLNPNTPVQILEDIGLLTTNLFAVNGSIPVILTADSQMIALDPSSGVTRYSDPIADSANGMGGFSTSASYLAWHVNGLDSAFYLADGSTGWFRLCPTASPESGFTWSPKANIVGGVAAIQSIETSPGVKNLLLGPTTSGPILKRDLALNSDNGTPYAANFTVGSIVLAQSHQCAEVESISTYCMPIGSHPIVAVLGSEIAPSGGTPFEVLTPSVPEPPFLATATSIFSERWYFQNSGTTQPIWLQHMQIKFSWPTEAAANELLSFGIFGCVHI